MFSNKVIQMFTLFLFKKSNGTWYKKLDLTENSFYSNNNASIAEKISYFQVLNKNF